MLITWVVNMDKYVNADRLISSLEIDPFECPGCPEPEYLPELIELLRQAPAADVVEPVRCAHCKWCDEVDEHELWCNGNGWPARLVRPTDYCSSGDRKDE